MIYIAAIILGILFVWFLLLAAGLGAMVDRLSADTQAGRQAAYCVSQHRKELK